MGDIRKWKEDDSYQKGFERLLRDGSCDETNHIDHYDIGDCCQSDFMRNCVHTHNDPFSNREVYWNHSSACDLRNPAYHFFRSVCILPGHRRD